MDSQVSVFNYILMKMKTKRVLIFAPLLCAPGLLVLMLDFEGVAGFFEDAYLSPMIVVLFAFLLYFLMQPATVSPKLSEYAKSQRLKNAKHFTRIPQAISCICALFYLTISYDVLRTVFSGVKTHGTVLSCNRDPSTRRSLTHKKYAEIEVLHSGTKYSMSENLPSCERFIGKNIDVIINEKVIPASIVIDRWSNKFGSISLAIIFIVFVFFMELGLRRARRMYKG